MEMESFIFVSNYELDFLNFLKILKKFVDIFLSPCKRICLNLSNSCRILHHINALQHVYHPSNTFQVVSTFCLLQIMSKKDRHTSFFPGGSEVKASDWNAGDPGSIPESGRSPGEGNGNPLQYSCLENPMEGGAW